MFKPFINIQKHLLTESMINTINSDTGYFDMTDGITCDISNTSKMTKVSLKDNMSNLITIETVYKAADLFQSVIGVESYCVVLNSMDKRLSKDTLYKNHKLISTLLGDNVKSGYLNPGNVCTIGIIKYEKCEFGNDVIIYISSTKTKIMLYKITIQKELLYYLQEIISHRTLELAADISKDIK